MPNPTIVVGHIDSTELTNSIDKLVKEVAEKTGKMADGFTDAITKMNEAMKSFAVNQKVSVTLMKEAWRDMSSSFDAMVRAQESATSGGSGGRGSGTAHAPNTVGALEQEISLRVKDRKEMELGSAELREQNRIIDERRRKLKDETTSLANRWTSMALQMPTNSLDEASRKLKILEYLQNRYKNSTELSAVSQKRVADAIQRTRNQIDRIKPKKLDEVLGMDANSIDQIAAKMRALKMVQIDPNNAAEVKRVGDAYAELKRKQAQLMGQNIQLTHSNNYLAQSFGYIRNRIVYALTLGAVTNFVKQIYEIRGQYELLERSLGVLVNSFERGSQVFQQLNQMAIESPFTLMELAGAAKQLTAYNFTANEVVDTTRRLADISAALGVPMERLVYNLGQIRAQTVLTARDARDFANAGLPIVKSLADYYTELEGRVVSTGDVYDRMSKKMVAYNDVMAVLNKMTDQGGKFFEFQAKQAETLRVQMANLTLAWNNMLNEMGKNNQNWLSLPVQGLKAMLQNWASLNRVLKNVIISFGLMRLAQMVAIRYNWELAASAGGAAKMMGFLANTIKGVAASTAALFTNPWTWFFVGVLAITDLIGKMRAAKQATEELNEEIRKGATEASESNVGFLTNKGNKATLELAKQNKLTAEQGEKAWQAIEQQISTSAMSANKLLGELWAIDDINERVKKGFEYTESIQKAQAALQDLQEDTITLTRDKGWWGVLGEGLVSDLKDFYEDIQRGAEYMSSIAKTTDDLYGAWLSKRNISKEAGGDARYQFEKELKETAESINNFIVAHKIKDPLQINEILERVRAVIKTKNPEIKGDLATLFDVELDTKMSELTNGVVDKNASLWDVFLDRLKHNYSNTFQGITSDIYKENAKLSKEQQDAVDANLEYFKNTMPFYYDAIKAMVDDASKLRINIGVTFGVQQLTDFQREFEERRGKAIQKLGLVEADKLTRLAPKQGQLLPDWVTQRQQSIAKLQEDEKKYQRDSTAWGKARLKETQDEIKLEKEALDLFNQRYVKDEKGGSKKDPVLDALKQTIDIIKKTQSEYDTLTKSGESSVGALQKVYGRYGKTLQFVNSQLRGFGLPEIDLSKIIKGKNPNDVVAFFKNLLQILTDKGLSNLERVKAVEVVIQEFGLKADTYNLDMITKGLNNELGKLKDEYELAISLDADPELGNVFADMMGINTETLPHTVKEYADKYTQYLNKYLKANQSDLQFNDGELLGLTHDDIKAFQEQVWAGTMNEAWFNEIKKAFDDISSKRKKDLDDTQKWSNSLIEKYGGLQAKLTKIYKDSVQNQVNAVKAFGNDEQESDIVRLQLQLAATDDPAELANINTQIASIVKDITDKHPIALKLVQAADNETESNVSKAYWEDFKESDLYTMTFEDMANNSTQAIQLIIDKLNTLKDKVKEDPASMKALIKSLEKAEDELMSRDPFAGIANSIKDWTNATKEQKVAQEELELANKEVAGSEIALKNAQSVGDKKAIVKAEQQLAQAQQKQATAQGKVVQSGNKAKKAQEQLKTSFQKLSNELGNVSGLLGSVSKIFRAVGDDDTADAIDAINEGFTIMTTVIMGVTAALIILELSNPWLLAMAAALSVIVGLVSFLSGNSNKKITEQVEESERAVKRLELAYIDLEHAVEKAYGMATIGANMAAKANKELQLAELKRQLALERSREGKNKDEDKILDLQKEIKELEYEIADTVDNIVNDLLGISSVGDAMENMMDAFIEALRSGEDAMATFNDSVDEMIANMVKKMFTTKILQPWFEEQWTKIQDQINERAGDIPDKLSKVQSSVSNAKMADVNNDDSLVDALRALGFSDDEINRLIWYDEFGQRDDWKKKSTARLRAAYEEALKEAEQKEAEMQKELTAATMPTTDDIRQYAELLRSGQPILEDNMQEVANFLKELGLMKDDANKNLSALQQGIQGITEDQAGALEAYWNINTQQQFVQSDLLREIRDFLYGGDADIQTGVQAQMLLQLQQSYQVQMAIQGILEGWSNPSGQAVKVELVS